MPVLLAAQSYAVSPAAYANAPSTGAMYTPFSDAASRHMQLHGDLRGKVLMLQGITFRRSPLGGSVRTAYVTILAGECNASAASATFASNYTVPPTTVFTRQNVSLPNWSTSTTNPAPWDLGFAFGAPYAHTGVTDLAWEAMVDTVTPRPNDYMADSVVVIPSFVSTPLGSACTATGQGSPLGLSCSGSLVFGIIAALNYQVANAVPGAPAVLILGPTNPDAAVFGLCTKLMSDATLALPGTTTATGTLALGLQATWSEKFFGANLFAQAACADPGQPGLPVAASHGLQTKIDGNLPPVRTVLARGSATATTGTVTRAACVITRFTHVP